MMKKELSLAVGEGVVTIVPVATVTVHCENRMKNRQRNDLWEKLKVVEFRCGWYMQ
jgi:hypothetical protein